MSSGTTTGMPSLGDRGAEQLAPGAVGYLDARSLLDLAAVTVVVTAAVLVTTDGPVRLVALGVVAALALLGVLVEVPVLNRLRVRYTTYSVQPEFVYITRGALVTRSVLIPIRQILNVETVQGPLLRRFGLVKVRFRCITEVEALSPLTPEAVAEIRLAVARYEDPDESLAG